MIKHDGNYFYRVFNVSRSHLNLKYQRLEAVHLHSSFHGDQLIKPTDNFLKQYMSDFFVL